MTTNAGAMKKMEHEREEQGRKDNVRKMQICNDAKMLKTQSPPWL